MIPKNPGFLNDESVIRWIKQSHLSVKLIEKNTDKAKGMMVY